MPTSLPFVDTLPPQSRMHDVRDGRVWNRDQLADAVAARADAIAGRIGVGASPLVVAEAQASETLISLFAAWAAGRMAVVVNPALAPPERANVIAHTQASAWVSEGGRIQPTGAPSSGGEPGEPRPLQLDAPALMMMTSGTTGVPKGIVHSLRSLAARVALNIAHIGTADLQSSLCVLPAFFGHGLIGNCMTPLAAGGRLHLWSTPQMTEIGGFTDVLETNEIGFMSAVPTFWKLALRLAPPARKTLGRVHVGSAPLSTSQWQAIADWAGTDRVFNMFGMTETANWIGGGSLADSAGRDGYVGRVWGGRYAVLGDNGTVAGMGRGEVLVSSPSIMLGYHGQAAANDAAFHGGWFRTGDVGELAQDGTLTLVGRIKSEINRAGIKVLAEEIDMMLERHDAVEEACAFALPDPVSGESVAAAIVLRAGAEADRAAIREWCRSQVRPEAVPGELFVVDAIPRNDRGKIVRAAVRDAVAG